LPALASVLARGLWLAGAWLSGTPGAGEQAVGAFHAADTAAAGSREAA